MILMPVLFQLLPLSCDDPLQCNTKHRWGFTGKYWMYSTKKGTRPRGSSNCPSDDMIEIKGNMGINPVVSQHGHNTIEGLQELACIKWSEDKPVKWCTEFDKQKWEESRKQIKTKKMHFCIDPYEWPNRKGAAPWIMETWEESKKLCESNGKRLCTEEEWTFSCEGEEILPFPTGYVRDSQKCNIDKPWRVYNNKDLFPRGTNKNGKELNRLWQGNLAGTNPLCTNSFGVNDLLGNVEEWTTSIKKEKNPSILKGGYWSGPRFRCRSSIRSHGTWHTFYQQGFRCCNDIKIT